MTVAVLVKVFDGIVLAADSATTLPLGGGSHQVWNNANKVFHLHRRYPIGAMTWGTGVLGAGSIESYAKDFRRRLMGRDPEHLDFALREDYTIEGVAGALAEMIYDEVYLNLEGLTDESPPTPGLLVAGYNGGSRDAVGWLIPPATRQQPPQVVQAVPVDASGWIAFAQDEATRRLFNGFDPEFPDAIQQALDPQEWAKIAHFFEGPFNRQAVHPAMPFADAIGFARYLVDVTVGYIRYLMGPDTVGGPVEVAGITRHEGFKWVSRKHYYTAALNPEEPRHEY